MDSARLEECLLRLTAHLNGPRVALTGGAAIGIHAVLAHGDHSRTDSAEDVDFVAEDVDAVWLSVTGDFLVSHFHLPQPGYSKFLIQLVDPAARLRIDIFPDALHRLSRASTLTVGTVALRVLQATDILDHKLAVLSGASSENAVDPKHYQDAIRLGIICGRDVPRVDPSLLARIPFSQDTDAVCPRCAVSRHPCFPLAPKRAIFEVLGYV